MLIILCTFLFVDIFTLMKRHFAFVCSRSSIIKDRKKSENTNQRLSMNELNELNIRQVFECCYSLSLLLLWIYFCCVLCILLPHNSNCRLIYTHTHPLHSYILLISKSIQYLFDIHSIHAWFLFHIRFFSIKVSKKKKTTATTIRLMSIKENNHLQWLSVFLCAWT